MLPSPVWVMPRTAVTDLRSVTASRRSARMVSVFHSIVNALSNSAWSYGIVFGVSALDAFFPLVPSETTVIAAGVLAANGDLRIELILPAAAIGAICGDNVSFWIGRT